MTARSPVLAPPARREAARALGTGCALALICWYLGVNVWYSILLGVAITVGLGALARLGASPETGVIHWRGGQRRQNLGSRNDVLMLSSSMRAGWGRVGRTAETRLWNIGRRRCALEGLDLADGDQRSAIERRIGRPAYRALVRANAHHGVSLRAFTHCLNALDSLDPTHYPAPVEARRTPHLMSRRKEPS